MKGLKTYFTFLQRNKLFTVVNVAGLSISLMFVLLIADMVTRQLSVDKNLKIPTVSVYLQAKIQQPVTICWEKNCKAATLK